ncbi:electron transfer flavoprotein subunit alpha/FixB family protein [Shimazuella sp. AN120528]|uniref:electron transfer flavoprotein subunit alpha/FixB family protein n=1 Tax=Shimazuella soli TaxID=1892854 RepID=UPI001F101D53|nr:electron transfer flavoprotein subunit alpha/FixB family protein [Shimazuella soli]MCH5584509.1 electron transfer flavoprotein subunit alpha/FixB family protein [Shimazuella soli]
MSKKVLVFADRKEGQLRQVTLESISAARTIVDDGEVTVALLGSDARKETDTLTHHGADRVLLVEDSQFDSYITDAYFLAWQQVIDQVKPDFIVTGHTTVGKDVSPRIAAHFSFGLISDCIAIERNGDEVIYTRPIYAGKAFVKKSFRPGVQFVTIRPNNIPLISVDPSRSAQIEELTVPIKHDLLRTIVTNVVKKAATGIDLSEARIVVSGGRGVKSAEGFQPLQELADVLNAAVGASRGACDAGYCDYALQIGQTGKVVTPDLYIACGISGAIQHVAGMSSSKVIVAINKDPDAPIFQIADYGIVGDLFEVVPLLTKELKKLLPPA